MKKSIAFVLLFTLLLTLLLSGCIEPEVKYSKSSWGKVNEAYTEIITKIGLYNPLPVPLPVKDVKTEIFMNGIKMGQGSAIKSYVGANTVSEVIISTKIDNNKIIDWWVSHIRNGEITNVEVRGEVILDIFGITFGYPIIHKTQIKTQILDYIALKNTKKLGSLLVKSANVRWGEVNKDRSEIVLNIQFKTALPIHVVKLKYYLELNGIVLANGVDTINKDFSKNVEFSMYIDNSKIPNWWISHIKNGEKSVGEVVIKPVVEIAGSEYEIPLIEQSINFETNMFGD